SSVDWAADSATRRPFWICPRAGRRPQSHSLRRSQVEKTRAGGPISSCGRGFTCVPATPAPSIGPTLAKARYNDVFVSSTKSDIQRFAERQEESWAKDPVWGNPDNGIAASHPEGRNEPRKPRSRRRSNFVVPRI